jgi:formate-nitrite transporter family protein
MNVPTARNSTCSAAIAAQIVSGIAFMADEDTKAEQAEERRSPSGWIVYKAIAREGEEELERSSAALWWSGLAAGLSMSFSMITEGLLMTHLPDAPWRELVSKLGYSIGFLIVILGRQQLFTENTLTPILPLLAKRDARTLGNVGRLWGIVFIANIVGALIMGYVAAQSSAFDPDLRHSFIELGRNSMQHDFASTFLRAIFAGWLIALMVWLLPFAESARVLVIIIITYVVGLGHFSHIIAGAVDVFTLAAANETNWGDVISGFLVPTLMGNIIGGVLLVATINYAQVVAGEKGQDV